MRSFQYVFYRAYLARRRADDPQPLIGALVAWAFYVAAPLVPLVVVLSHSQYSWVPQVVKERGPATMMVIMGIIYLFGYVVHVGNDTISRMDELFRAESPTLTQARRLFMWVWPALFLIVLVITIFYLRTQNSVAQDWPGR